MPLFRSRGTGGLSCAQQLLDTQSVLPFYLANLPCPNCSDPAQLLEAVHAEHGVPCSRCSCRVAISTSDDPWPMPGHTCLRCNMVLCVACNQSLQADQMVESARRATREEMHAELAPPELETSEANEHLSHACSELGHACELFTSTEQKLKSEIHMLQEHLSLESINHLEQNTVTNQCIQNLNDQISADHEEFTKMQDELSGSEAHVHKLSMHSAALEAAEAHRITNRAEAAQALSSQIDQTSAEINANLAGAHVLDHLTQESQVLAWQIQSEVSSIRSQELRDAAMDALEISDSRARLDHLYDELSVVRTTVQRQHSPSASSSTVGIRSLWGRVKDFGRSVDLLPSTENSRPQLQSGIRLGPHPVSTGAPTPIHITEPHTSLEQWEEETAAHLLRLNAAHDCLSELSLESDRLRYEAEWLHGTTHSEAARRGRARAELGNERLEAPNRAVKVREQLQAEIELYYKNAMSLISDLPGIRSSYGFDRASEVAIQQIAKLERALCPA